jgi:hypothetical protein
VSYHTVRAPFSQLKFQTGLCGLTLTSLQLRRKPPQWGALHGTGDWQSMGSARSVSIASGQPCTAAKH